MSHVPHELHDEFPQDVWKLHALKMESPQFGALADRYHLLNREIHRIESGIEAASDERTEALKKERLSMLDQVAKMLAEVIHG
jgi:uncharacterized protein YdcH (DUF465 family)